VCICLLTGDVDREEWNETVDFYLELKEEEEEMRKKEKSFDRAQFQRTLREQKLHELQQVTSAPGAKPTTVDVEAGRAPAAPLAVEQPNATASKKYSEDSEEEEA
jgi:hypothetical protein